MRPIKYSKLFLFTALLLCTAPLFSQSWQWARKGGTSDDTDNGNDAYEQVRSIVTDSHDNVYILSNVGIQSLNIDGHALPTYGLYTGGGNASLDYVISSFACDGTYRWSKVIGGQDNDKVLNLQIDAQDNIYAAGQAYNSFDDFFFPGTYPQLHFGEVIVPYAVNNAQGHETLFLIKYDIDGNLQWLKRPQPFDMNVSIAYQSITLDLQVDPQGNSYWLCSMGPGNYENNSLVTTERGYYILKYDSAGIFLGASLLDLQATGVGLNGVKMRRNHTSGAIYISNTLTHNESSTASVTIGGQPVIFSKFIAAFDDQGAFLWKRENNTLVEWGIGSNDMAIDSDNSIYLLGAAGRIELSIPNPVMESFNGQQFETPPGFTNLPLPYIVKLDPSGNTIWQSSGYNNIMHPQAITINGNEVALASGQRGMNWGPIAIPYNDKGIDVFIARLSKATGSVIDINTFASTTSADDWGTAISKDSQGNYLVGGRFWQQVTIGPDTLLDSGQETDFFIAKFGSNPCVMGIDEQQPVTAIKAYPNPVRDILQLDNSEPMEYAVYGLTGACLAKGSLARNGAIDLRSLASGLYILRLQSEKGASSIRIMKD